MFPANTNWPPNQYIRIIAAFILCRATTDFVVGAGLIIVLLVSVVMGNGSTELQTTIASGLVGDLGRSILDEAHLSHGDGAHRDTPACGTGSPSKKPAEERKETV